MPAVITHYLMGQASLYQLQDECLQKQLLRRQAAFNLGTQGPDALFYAPLDKKLREQGHHMHRLGIGGFFDACLRFIHRQRAEEEKNILISYMSGFLCHYALDAWAHPYVYYQTGFSDESGGLRDDCVRRHRFWETTIDCVLAQKFGDGNAYLLDISHKISVPPDERRLIGQMLSNSIQASYGFARTAAAYDAAMRNIALAYWLFHDKAGRRRAAVSILGKLIRDHGATAALIHYGPVDESVDYLNLKRQTWRVPWDDSIELTFSFMDLFEIAVEESLIYIGAFVKAVQGKLDPKIALHILGNKNFSTGLESFVKFLYYNKAFERQAPEALEQSVNSEA
ncbi:MAG: zinc dependent phospholipase C family protein [Clostridiales bacterium]|jgi:hypothetical protein|nr:zinc dependent phospholipase C family protein [Clostridiales bacterium]